MGRVRSETDNQGRTRIRGIRRGMIFWVLVRRSETTGTEQYSEPPRPWLVVSSNQVHSRYPSVLAVPLTSSLSQGPKFKECRICIVHSEINFYPEATPPLQRQDQLVYTEGVRALSHDRLQGDPVADVSPRALAMVEAGLRFALDIAEVVEDENDQATSASDAANDNL
jgi:mRNA-degrading endonuclease toxin of MazEF toxin-antitoxin module